MSGYRVVNKLILEVSENFYIYNKSTKSVIKEPTEILPGMVSATLIDPYSEEIVVKPTLEELMEDFNLRGLVMPDADFWDHPQKEFRLNIPNDDIPKIILASPTVALKLEALKLWIVERNRSQLIYITSLDAEDKMLEKYLQPRFENPII